MTVHNCKAKGTRAEHRSMRLLEGAGYAVTRAAASLGAWDLVAISSTDFVVVQVKSNRPPCPAEMETLKNFPCPSNCRRLVHVGPRAVADRKGDRMSRFLISWPAGRWSSMVTDSEAEALEMQRRGAEVQEVQVDASEPEVTPDSGNSH